MRELNLDQLRTLLAIADLGSFSAAARALHLAQPTVSLHISELEARLGCRLVERGARLAALTDAGSELVRRARQLLRDADDAVDAVRRHAEGRIGRVRLGTSTGVLVHFLPQVLEAMARDYPGIDVEVGIFSSAETLAGLTQGTLDIGLVSTPQPPQRNLVLTHWRSDPMAAFVPAAWQTPKRITPQWLVDKPLIFNESNTHMYRLTMEWFAAAGFNPRARIELNFTEAMKSLVAAGYGAAVLPVEDRGAPAPRGVRAIPLKPGLIRHIGIAHRPAVDGAVRNLLTALSLFRQS